MFTVPLKAGPALVHTWFDDDLNQPLCGAYYVHVKRRSPSGRVRVSKRVTTNGGTTKWVASRRQARPRSAPLSPEHGLGQIGLQQRLQPGPGAKQP